MHCYHKVMVWFTSNQFAGTEISKFAEVVVIMSGTSASPVTISITPSMLSPVSAMSKLCTLYFNH